MPSFMTSLDRKLRASAFVRRNSGKVATDLPQNELAQFLHKREEDKAAMQDIESVHNSMFNTQCLDAGSSDRSEPETIINQ